MEISTSGPKGDFSLIEKVEEILQFLERKTTWSLDDESLLFYCSQILNLCRSDFREDRITSLRARILTLGSRTAFLERS